MNGKIDVISIIQVLRLHVSTFQRMRGGKDMDFFYSSLMPCFAGVVQIFYE
jgi:hypothetical protein